MIDNTKVWYLFHSGFAVKHNNNLFIFDYYNNIPKNQKFDLNHGVINPEEIKDMNVYVFVSHGHYDHYNSIIFTWASVVKNIHYFVTEDIKLNRDKTNVMVVKPRESYSINDITISTLHSNDLGVAYIVESKDLTLFHSGDLNWWVGADPIVNAEDERIFKEEYNLVKYKKPDIAFIPVSPKLKQNYSLSIEYFLNHIAKEDCLIFPMHFALNIEIFNWLKRDGILGDSRIQSFMYRGLVKLNHTK